MYLLDIPGMTGEEKVIRKGTPDSSTIYEFIFDNNANEQTVTRLIDGIPPEAEFMFYDRDYPSPSDPGAFVSIKRVENRYTMKRANHGWSDGWKPISFENLVSYLSKCIEYNTGSDSMSKMRLYPPPSLPQKQWWQFWK
jgi:hypothetical protein